MSKMRLLCLLFLVSSCASKSIAKDRTPHSKKEAANLAIDDETDIGKALEKRVYTTKVLMEEAPKMGHQIDGDISDWKNPKFREFQTKRNIESGADFWDGKNDLSARVAFESDGGWVYFFIQVKDDKVISGTNDEFADGVRIIVRDPGLDTLQRSLPMGVGLDEYVNEVTEFRVLPDGRVLDTNGNPLTMVEAGVDEKKNGYLMEVAFPLEVFGSVSNLPLNEMAFRVDVLDGDDPDNIEIQTILSSVVSSLGTRNRLAKVKVNLVPQKGLATGVPRKNAIGRWKYEEGKWSFLSFEMVPKSWVAMVDQEAFLKELKGSSALKKICNLAKNDLILSDAYRSSGGGFSSALLICGTKLRKDKCPTKATTKVLWVSAEKENEGWSIKKSINVFGKSLGQCALGGSKKDDYYSDFSLFPLDMLGTSFWMVGWTGNQFSKGYSAEKNGIVFLNTKAATSVIANLITNAEEITRDERILSKTTSYLALLDDDKFVDICQIEEWEEQTCMGYKKDCSSKEEGVRFNIYMWDQEDSLFESFGLIKHKRCRTSFDLKEEKSYLILQMRKRIGLLPFPVKEW